jgi:hypothetical protein
MSVSVAGNAVTFANDAAGWEQFRMKCGAPPGFTDGKRAFFLYQGFCIYSEVH